LVVATGLVAYPHATTLQITADCGGGNGNRVRLWTTELQRLADDSLEISVCHFPPGTSKWNKIEHRLWSFIAKNWRGRPLVSHEVIINSIAATSTDTGLRPTRRTRLPPGRRRHRRATRRGQPGPQRLPRRMELHHQPSTHLRHAS
jgi:hypothetical protein